MIKNFQLSKRRVYYYLAFLLLTIIIIIAGRFYYLYTIQNTKEKAYDNISSLANLKIREIIRWKDEKYSEAEFLYENEHFKEIVYSFILTPHNPKYKSEITDWLKSLLRNSDYSNAIVIWNKKNYLPFFKEEILGDQEFKFYNNCISKNKIILTNFRENNAGKPTLDFFIPMNISGELPFAVLLLRINPSKQLFRILKSRPALSNTAQSVLFQRDSDSISIIGELQLKKKIEKGFDKLLQDESFLIPKASSGARGIHEVIDHRGVKVLADIEKIPNTPWYIVTKIDLKELYLPVRQQTFYIIAVFLLLIALSGILTFIFWKNERIRYYDQRLLLEQERNALKEKLDYLVEYANDIIIVMDTKGSILEANKKAMEFYGYDIEELLSLNINNLRIEEYRSDVHDLVKKIRENQGLIYESRHQNKNGDKFYVEVSSKIIEVDGKEHLQSIIRDISDRKEAEEMLRISAERFQEMFNVDIIGICISELNRNIIQTNDYFLKIIGYSREEFLNNHMSWDALTPNEFLTSDYKAIEELLRMGSCNPYEKQYITKTGVRVWVFISLALLPGTETQIVAFIQDINKRKKTEEALKKSEEKFMKLFDDSPIAMGLFNIEEFRTIDINRAFEKLYGFSKEEIVGNPPIQEVFTDDRQRNMLTVSTLKKKPIKNFELKVKSKSGQNKVVSLTNVFIEIDGIHCLFSISYDITDRKRAENALKKSEEKFAIMFKDSPVSMIVMDIETTTTLDVNKAFEKLYGYTREEVIGKPPPDLFANPEQLKIIIDHTVSGKPLYNFEVNIITKNGAHRIFSVTNEFIEIENRQCILSAAYDITEKKLAEEAIRKNEAQLQQMADAIPHIIYSTEPDGTIIYINNRFGEYAGVNTQIYYGWQWSEFIHPDDLSGAKAKWMKAFSEIAEYEDTIRLKKFNGEYEWFLARVVPIKDSSGQLIRWFASATNINEQRNAYEEIQKLLNEVERSNKDLEQFAYVASHDLQEPLRMIKSYIQLLEYKNGDKLDVNSREFLGFISEGATRMQELINDLLKYSRITSKKPEFEAFNCNSVLNEVLADLRFKIQEENAIVESENLPMVRADKIQIRQLFQNLIQNALKFRGEKDPEIQIRVVEKNGFWLFSIRDNGIGIEEKNYGRVFEIFQRLHEREKYPGTGIGLALCKKIVERHGGNIYLESAPGKGTTFYFTLPMV